MAKPETKVFISITLIAVVLLSVVVGLMQLVYRNYEVVEKGQLLPYSKGIISKVRLFNRWTVYMEFERLPNIDLFTAILWGAGGWSALLFSGLIRILGQKPKNRAVPFLFWAGILMIWLAADEYFGLHETIGHNLQWLRSLPGIDAPDDFIVLLYGCAGVVGLLIFRKIILTDRLAIFLWGLAAGMGFLTGAADIITRIGGRLAYYAEEFSELAVVALILFGTLRLGITLLRNSLPLAPE